MAACNEQSRAIRLAGHMFAEQAAESLAETFAGSFDDPRVAVAAAAADKTGPVSRISPESAPAAGRFEIGSVTKTMTATLLALLAAEGALSLDDEAGSWLDAGPNAGITLRELATHTSGLPPVAPGYDLRQADRLNPWADFTAAIAENGLRQATRAPGRTWQYSNFGYQLLGLVLQRASSQAYPDLLSERLLDPLGMTGSGAGQRAGGPLLPGHVRGREVPHRDHPVPGPGGVRVTASDLARYAQACLDPPAGPLGAAMTAAQEAQVPIDAGHAQALAWIVVDGNLRGHTGGTTGFSSCLIVDPAAGHAVALLASSHGCGEALARAARAVLTGQDPRTVPLS